MARTVEVREAAAVGINTILMSVSGSWATIAKAKAATLGGKTLRGGITSDMIVPIMTDERGTTTSVAGIIVVREVVAVGIV